VNKIEGGGNWILVTIFRTLFLLAFVSAGLAAQTAILECVTAVESNGRLRLTFRTALAEKFKIQRATLLLHLRDSKPPASVKVNGKKVSIVSQADNWVTFALPSKDAFKPISVDTRAARFHGCSPPPFAPYLVLEGPSPSQKK